MATFLRNQGVPLDVVQLLLGHSDPRTTQLYARLSLADSEGELRPGDGRRSGLKARPATVAACVVVALAGLAAPALAGEQEEE